MFLVTPRLLLRPPWPEDAAPIAAAMEWDVARMTGSMPWPYALADAEAWVARPAEKVTHTWLVIASRDGMGAPIGAIGFVAALHGDDLELGYWLARSAWGCGIATEAGGAFTAFAFDVLGLEALGAGHYADNPASGRVLGKLGFRTTGDVIDYPCRSRGGSVPSVEYRLEAADWRAARAQPPGAAFSAAPGG